MLNPVSPAVVVPTCVHLHKSRIGTAKGIPTLILASASFDDVIAIAGFSIFCAIIFSTQRECSSKLYTNFAIDANHNEPQRV